MGWGSSSPLSVHLSEDDWVNSWVPGSEDWEP